MKILNMINGFVNQWNQKKKSYESLHRAMTDEEREYEREKLHQLINSQPMTKKFKSEFFEERDISAD